MLDKIIKSRGSSTDNLMLEKIIKSRAWEWSISNNSMAEKWRNLWACNPIKAYEAHRKDSLNLLLTQWFKEFALVGFTDGAVSTGSTGLASCTKAGIGGFFSRK